MKKLVCVALSLISVIVLFAGCTPEKDADSITTEATTAQTTQTVPTTQNTTTETTQETTAPTTAPTTKPTTPKPTTPKPTTPKPTEPKTTEPKAKVLVSKERDGKTLWEITDDGVLTIVNPSIDSQTNAWRNNSDLFTKVVFSENITKIRSEAFYNFTNIESVQLSDSITSIGMQAFAYCTSLQSIKITKNIKTIDFGAFFGCKNLKTLTFASGCKLQEISKRVFGQTGLTEFTSPSTLRTIADDAFYKCEKLETVRLEGGVTTVEGGAFEECYALKKLVLGASITELGALLDNNLCHITTVEYYTSAKYNFSYMPYLTTVKIGGERTSIGNFGHCTALENVTISSKITKINDSAFIGCTSLTSFTIPSTVEEIGNNAFRYTGLRSITIPSKVKKLGLWAFADTPLKKITFSGNAPSCEGYVFSGVSASAYYPAGNKTWTQTAMDNFGGANIFWYAK